MGDLLGAARIRQCRRRLGKSGGVSEIHDELEVSLPAHAGGSEQVLYHEDRNFVISRNDERTGDAGLGVNEMISALPVEGESIPLEDIDQQRIVSVAESGHYRTLAVSRPSATNSGASQESPFRL